MKKTRTTEIVAVSLPPAMVRHLEKAQKAENRTRSELVREALRFYLLRAVAPSAQERRAIEKGRAEIRRGDFVTLDELHAELDRLHLLERAQSRPARSTSRARATTSRARSTRR